MDFWCQFHQHFTCSFYARRSQKHQMTLLTWLSFFAHSGSTCVKDVHRMLMKLSPDGGMVDRTPSSTLQEMQRTESRKTGISLPLWHLFFSSISPLPLFDINKCTTLDPPKNWLSRNEYFNLENSILNLLSFKKNFDLYCEVTSFVFVSRLKTSSRSMATFTPSCCRRTRRPRLNRCQFHQNFTCNFFIQKCFAKLFSYYNLALYNFLAKEYLPKSCS